MKFAQANSSNSNDNPGPSPVKKESYVRAYKMTKWNNITKSNISGYKMIPNFRLLVLFSSFSDS